MGTPIFWQFEKKSRRHTAREMIRGKRKMWKGWTGPMVKMSVEKFRKKKWPVINPRWLEKKVELVSSTNFPSSTWVLITEEGGNRRERASGTSDEIIKWEIYSESTSFCWSFNNLHFFSALLKCVLSRPHKLYCHNRRVDEEVQRCRRHDTRGERVRKINMMMVLWNCWNVLQRSSSIRFDWIATIDIAHNSNNNTTTYASWTFSLWIWNFPNFFLLHCSCCWHTTRAHFDNFSRNFLENSCRLSCTIWMLIMSQDIDSSPSTQPILNLVVCGGSSKVVVSKDLRKTKIFHPTREHALSQEWNIQSWISNLFMWKWHKKKTRERAATGNFKHITHVNAKIYRRTPKKTKDENWRSRAEFGEGRK